MRFEIFKIMIDWWHSDENRNLIAVNFRHFGYNLLKISY